MAKLTGLSWLHGKKSLSFFSHKSLGGNGKSFIPFYSPSLGIYRELKPFVSLMC